QIEPCGVCQSCIMVQGDTHPDLRIVQKEKTKYGVSEIREQVVQDIVLQPMIGKHRVYIIPEADRMGDEAQNALLKTLEEPPSYACIFLLSERPQALLATIRSRTVSLSLKAVPQEKIEQYLMERVQVPDYRARECAILAEGNVGRAIEYAQSERFAEQVRQTMRLLTELPELTVTQIMERLRTLLLETDPEGTDGSAEKKPKKKGLKEAGDTELAKFIDLLVTLTRDALVYKAGAENRLVFADGEAYDREMVRHSWEELYGRIGMIRRAREQLNAEVNTDLVLELLFLEMRKEKTERTYG
ncbi:MAG: DNA polymerase III subunit delta, partial [Lachnospiraceae bacterium]|nr:DNA polymerase III subunit delta [Lachnospiraceae bacterium]